MTNIPLTDFGGTGEQMHFAHANGYPPGTYLELIDLLKSDYSINAQHFRPLWDDNHNQLKNWKMFSDDMITAFDQQGMKNVIGVGHSMGGITSVVSAVRRPDLFSKLILMDPVILPAAAYRMTDWLPVFLSKKFVPIAKISIKRRDRWESEEELFESFRKKKIFRSISDKGLRLFAKHATKPAPEGGIQLAYSKEWETQVYCTPIQPWKYLKQLNIPTLIIKAQYSNVITKGVWDDIQSTVKNGTFVEMQGTSHLVPMEAPDRLADLIKKWLKE